MRRDRPPGEIEELFNEQIQALRSSADAYDKGSGFEAKRIATAIRILCHSRGQSVSLIEQTGRRARRYLSSAEDPFTFDLGPRCSIVWLNMPTSEEPAGFSAPLDRSHMWFTKFEDWWREPIINDPQLRRQFSRADIVHKMADQDGGAHVDPRIDEAYQHLKETALGMRVNRLGQDLPLAGPERPAVRQIGHEMLKSLDPTYGKEASWGNLHPMPILSSVSMARRRRRRGYQESSPASPCPCQSGMLFRDCHLVGSPPVRR